MKLLEIFRTLMQDESGWPQQIRGGLWWDRKQGSITQPNGSFAIALLTIAGRSVKVRAGGSVDVYPV